MGGDKTRIYSIIRKGSCKEDSILSAKLSLVDGYIAAGLLEIHIVCYLNMIRNSYNFSK